MSEGRITKNQIKLIVSLKEMIEDELEEDLDYLPFPKTLSNQAIKNFFLDLFKLDNERSKFIQRTDLNQMYSGIDKMYKIMESTSKSKWFKEMAKLSSEETLWSEIWMKASEIIHSKPESALEALVKMIETKVQ